MTKDVLQCIPEDWQIYTLESADNEKILEHIVNSDALSHIMSHCDSLKNARDTMEDALPRLMLDESEAPLKFDAKFEERMDTLYNEGELLLAARAACTVALKEVLESANKKARSALSERRRA